METWDCRERECGHGDGWGAGVIDDDDDRQISMLIRPTEIRCGGRELRGVRDETRAGRRDSEAMIGLCGEQENATRQVNWATVACAACRHGSDYISATAPPGQRRSQKFPTRGASICSIPFCPFPFSCPTNTHTHTHAPV